MFQGYLEVCATHRCQFAGCRETHSTVPGSTHCTNHDICGKNQCSNSRKITDRFCNSHRTSCWEKDCAYVMYSAENGFCETHACAEAARSCAGKKQPNRQLCDRHFECEVVGCTQVCELPRKTCDVHKCRLHNCIEAKCSEYSDYRQHRTYKTPSNDEQV
jgi:hypothetical protein